MRQLLSLSTLSLCFAILFSLSLAASSTSFCKCTCDKNSTIIPLSAPKGKSDPPAALFVRSFVPDSPSTSYPIVSREEDLEDSDGESKAEDDTGKEQGKEGDKQGKEGDEDKKEYRPLNCNDCNKSFCLSYNLPICKGVDEEKVFTTCFQRDSRKDEAVVFIFIFATAGLLGWAAIKPWVGKWAEGIKERRNYIPLAHEGAEET